MRNDQVAAEVSELKSAIRDLARSAKQGQQQQENILARMEAISRELAETKLEVSETKAAAAKTEEIVTAWNAVKTGGKFLKWFSGIVAAIGAIIVATKAGISSLTGKI